MKSIYFTITGTNHYYGLDFFEPKMIVHLVKEPDNIYDIEAVRVELEGLGKVGYVANSTYTVLGESFSAGRLYDKIGGTAEGSVLYKLRNGVLCILTKNDDPDYEPESSARAADSYYSTDDDEYDAGEYDDDDPDVRDDKSGGLTINVPDVGIEFN